MYVDASGRVPGVYLGSRLMGSIARDTGALAVGAGFWGYVGAAEAPGYAGMSLGRRLLVNRAMAGTFMTNVIEFELGTTAATAYSVGDAVWKGVQVYDYGHQAADIISH